MPRRPKVRAEPVTILDPSAPVTLTHTVGGLSVEVPPIVREESAEKWGYVAPLVGGGPLAEVVDSPVGGVYPAVPFPPLSPDFAEELADTNAYLDKAATLSENARGPTEGVSLAGVPDGSVTPTMPVTSPFTSDGNVAGADYLVTQVVQATAEEAERVIMEMRRPPTPEEYAARILAEDPRTALALYRRVSRGYGLAEWRPLGSGAQLVDLGTGHMLALVAPEGRRFVASYVESGTNLAGPTADTLDACKDAVANRMRARGVGVL